MEFERKLWVYWDKGLEKMPSLLRRIYDHNCLICAQFNWEVILLTLENIRDYIKNIHERFFSMTAYEQSDYVRFYALRDYSGIWLDTDFIVTDNLDKLFEMMNEKETFLGIQEHREGCIGSAVIAAKKNDLISIFNCQEIDRRVREIEEFSWGIIGPDILKVTPDNLLQYFKKIDDITAINSVNFANWLRNPGMEICWWYKEDDSQAEDVADFIKSYSFPIVGTWTIYRNHLPEISDNLVEMIFDDKKSVFHHLIYSKEKSGELKVLYGGGNIYKNVTEIFIQKFISNNIIKIPENRDFNNIFGDPIPGIFKSLITMVNGKIIIVGEYGDIFIKI